MADQDIKAVSAATGTYPAMRPKVRAEAETGNQVPESGKDVPEVERPEPNMKELAKALNVASQSIGRDLRFEVDMETGHSVIQVLDRETGEVIRQIPPEKAQLTLSGSGAVQLKLYDEVI